MTAVAGNAQAAVSFVPPANNGGTAIARYEVTSSPGNIVATGTSSPITVSGLTNGVSYTFTVKAINSSGSSAASAPSNAVTPISEKSSEGPDNSSPSPEQPATDNSTPSKTAVEVLVNGKAEIAGTATTTQVKGQTVTTVTVDSNLLDTILASEGRNAVVTIAVNAKSDVVIGELNGQMVKTMESKQATVVLLTEYGSYTLPFGQIHIDSISERIGRHVALADIKIEIEIAKPSQATLKVVEQAAAAGSFKIVVPPLDFALRGTYGDTRIELNGFDAYVERKIAIPADIDPNKITTGVVVEPDGNVRHVPTQITVADGKYYAVINSLTNSTYALVWNPVAFRDVADHWSKDIVNDMGSRMVVNGTGSGLFHPDQPITRAEFTAIVIRGLGLKLEDGSSRFADVNAADWYGPAIQTAYSHNLIGGFEDGTFRPMDEMTREQAMVIIAQAMKLTGLNAKLPTMEPGIPLSRFADGSIVADWAAEGMRDGLQAGIVSGRSNLLAPQAQVTRAETAAMVRRLLEQSDLINN